MATAAKKWHPTQTRNAWVAVGELLIDESYERPLNTRKVFQIQKDFDPDAIGVIYVAEREDGRKYVLDGQHRCEAVRRLWGATAQVPCLIYVGLSHQQEAALYVEFNEHRTKPKPLDLFKAKVEAEDPQALAIMRCVNAVGMDVGKASNQVNCVTHLARVEAQAGEEILAQTLQMLTKAWGYSANATQGPLVDGAAIVLSRYRSVIDDVRLMQTLKSMTPDTVMSRARLAKDAALGGQGDRSRLESTVAQLLVSLYNKKLRGSRVLQWEDRPSSHYWTDVSQMPTRADEFGEV